MQEGVYFDFFLEIIVKGKQVVYVQGDYNLFDEIIQKFGK